MLATARALAAQGAYTEAVRKFRWLFHRPRTYSTEPLREWASLGRAYPPARTALEEYRDQLAAPFVAQGSGDYGVFLRLISINEALETPSHTTGLFKIIASADRTLARTCFREALPALIYSQEFALARGFFHSSTSVLDTLCTELLDNLEYLPPPSEVAKYQLTRRVFIDIYVRNAREVIAVLRGVNEIAESDQMRQATIEQIEDASLREEIRLVYEHQEMAIPF